MTTSHFCHRAAVRRTRVIVMRPIARLCIAAPPLACGQPTAVAHRYIHLPVVGWSQDGGVTSSPLRSCVPPVRAAHGQAWSERDNFARFLLLCDAMAAACVPPPSDPDALRPLIRVWPITVRGGMNDATEDCVLVFKSGHPGCALHRWCGNERLDNRGDPYSKRLYSVSFSRKARAVEQDANSASLGVLVKQAICKACESRLYKRHNPHVTYDAACVELLHNLWGVKSSPATCVADWERCMAASAGALVPCLPRFAPSVSYVEPLPLVRTPSRVPGNH